MSNRIIITIALSLSAIFAKAQDFLSIGLPPVQPDSVAAYKQRAEAGDTEAMRLYGLCLIQGIGTERQTIKGLEQYGEATRQGDDDALFDLGIIYRDGLGAIPKSPVDAAYFFRKAGMHGHTLALMNIAYMFDIGSGVLPDSRVAAENYWRAAERGEPEAMYIYAERLLNGVGVNPDPEKARMWFNKAAAKNFKDAAARAHEIDSDLKKEESQKK